jgi:cell division protease FtsH
MAVRSAPLPSSARVAKLHIREDELNMQLITTAKRDLLARAYLDMLAAREGTNGGPLLRSGDPNDPVEMLISDLSAAPETIGRTSIRADLAAAAVLIARAIENVDGLTRDLRRGAPVVAIATHGAEIVMLIRDVMKTCAFGNDAKTLEEGRFDDTFPRPVLLIARDGTGKDDKADRGNDAVAKALHSIAPIVGIAPDPKRHLPRDLMRAAEHHLALGQLDASAISLVIEAATGKRPQLPIDERLVRAVEVSDLALSIRSDRTADDCVRRLEQIVSTKSIFDHRGPTLDELSGYGEAQDWATNLVADLDEYKNGRLDWESIERGALFSGPPGVGKTQLVRAIAKSANVPLVSTSVADWNASAYLSGTLAAIKHSFSQARQLSPCVLFIDELDGIGDRATISNEYREYWLQIVNLLLEQLQGVEERAGVVVIGATNHPDKIDAAIKRAGRLDRIITIELPDAKDLAKIFRFYLGSDLLPQVDLMPAALASLGKTGADVESWVRRAKSHARRGRRPLTFDDILHEVRSGRASMPDFLRRVCAVHEAGHLATGVVLDVFEPQSLAIAETGGSTRVQLSWANAQTATGMENFVVSLLAGRAAEEIILGPSKITAGAGVGEDSDFARATEAAVDMEMRLGLGIMGTMHFADRTTELLLQDPSVLARIRERLDGCMARARDIVEVNRGFIEAVAARLEEASYMERTEIGRLLENHPLRLPQKRVPANEGGTE